MEEENEEERHFPWKNLNVKWFSNETGKRQNKQQELNGKITKYEKIVD